MRRRRRAAGARRGSTTRRRVGRLLRPTRPDLAGRRRRRARPRRLARRLARLARGVITSRDNERLKLVRKLRDRRWRDKLGLFVAEGEDLVDGARAAGMEPVELLRAGENVET